MYAAKWIPFPKWTMTTKCYIALCDCKSQIRFTSLFYRIVKPLCLFTYVIKHFCLFTRLPVAFSPLCKLVIPNNKQLAGKDTVQESDSEPQDLTSQSGNPQNLERDPRNSHCPEIFSVISLSITLTSKHSNQISILPPLPKKPWFMSFNFLEFTTHFTCPGHCSWWLNFLIVSSFCKNLSVFISYLFYYILTLPFWYLHSPTETCQC